MGADGGLSWIKIKNYSIERRQKLINLIEPLGLLQNQWHKNDIEYNRNNPKTPDYLIIPYGTFCPNEGLIDLRHLIEEEDQANLTFEEKLEDLATRPEWLMYNLSFLENLLLYELDYYSNKDNYRNLTPPNRLTLVENFKHTSLVNLSSLKISDWQNQILDLVDWSTLTSIQTWT